VGNRAVPDRFRTYDDSAAASDVFTTASVATDSGTVYLKIVNPEPVTKELRVVLRGNEQVERRASYVLIRSDDLMVRNQHSPDHSELVRPVTRELGTVRGELVVEVPGHSVGALVLRPARR
jgi:hypothetical protein